MLKKGITMNIFNNDPSLKVLRKLVMAGLFKKTNITVLLEKIYPQGNYSESGLVSQDNDISRLLNNLYIEKNINAFDKVIVNQDVLKMDPDAEPVYDYYVSITEKGYEFINKIKDRERWMWTTILSILSFIIALISLVVRFK